MSEDSAVQLADIVHKRFAVGDRVGAVAPVREQFRQMTPGSPWYGHVINVGRQRLIWVRDHLGGEWGLPASQLEHID